MPTIDDVLPKLKGAKIFSSLDAKDGFLQVRLTERSSYLKSSKDGCKERYMDYLGLQLWQMIS